MWQEPTWTWTWLWQYMDRFMKAILVLLVFTLFHACVVFAERVWRFRVAAKQVPRLSRIIDTAGDSSAVHSAVSAIRPTRNSVLARVMAAGLEAFQSAPSFCSAPEVIELAQRAMDRAGALVHAEMKCGFSTVATIAALAPFIGLSGTVVGLLDATRGGSGTPEAWRVFYGNSIAIALAPTAIGLFVGVMAVCFYNHLIRRLEMFDLQSATAAARVITYLRSRLDGRNPSDTPPNLVSTPLFSAGAADWEARFDAHRVLLGSVWLVWLYVFSTIVWAAAWNLTHPYY